LANAKAAELLDHLKSPEDWTRHNAKRVLKERGAKDALPALKEWIAKHDDEHDLLEALWVQQSLDAVNADLLNRLLRAKDYRVRAASVRVLTHWHDRLPNALELLAARANDENPRVRMEAVRSLAELKTARAVEVAMTALDRPTDKVLEYALWLTAKELEPLWLPALKDGRLDFGGNPRHLSFALQTVGTSAGIQPILKLIESKKLPYDREYGLWLMLARIGGKDELGKVLDYAGDPKWSDEARDNLVIAVEDSVRQRKVGPPSNTDSLYLLLPNSAVQARRSAARLIGLWKVENFRASLVNIAKNAKVNADDRQAAFEALAEMGGTNSKEFFEKMAAAEMDATTRRLAVTALSTIDLTAGAKTAAAILEGAKPSDDLLILYAAFLQRKGGAAALTKALDGKKLAADVARLGIRAVRSSVQDAPDLIAALQKAGDLAAQKRELTKAELDEMVADVQKIGNAARGELLYRRADMQCLKCHAIGGAGGQVGPDLVSVGASAPVDYLIESLLIPNKAVKEGFHSLRVETLDGKVHIGVKLRESKSEIVLRNAEDKEIVIPANDVDTKRESRSLMPDGLVDTLTRGELIDLTRFLSELGKVGPYSLTKARVVRRWQALQNTPQAGNLIRRSRIAAAAENDPAFVWNSAYAKVSGDLPLEALPTLTIWQDTAPLIVVRALLDVTAAGKVKVKLNSAMGISLLVGANPVEVKDETIVDLPQGQQVLLFAIDTTKRKEPLRCELEDVEGSPARVSVLGGK
jgi:putative heme-binding domain-containing protein